MRERKYRNSTYPENNNLQIQKSRLFQAAFPVTGNGREWMGKAGKSQTYGNFQPSHI